MTLTEACAILKKAQHPEDVFPVNGEEPSLAVKKRYRTMAVVTHTDKAGAEAEWAFKLLNEWHEKAQAKLAAGTFGNRHAIHATLTTKSTSYTLTEDLGPRSVYNCYGGTVTDKTDPLFFRITANPRDNDLARNEAEKLKWLRTESQAKDLKTLVHITEFVDSFEITQDGVRQQVNVYPRLRGYVTLADVIKAYPDGIELRSAAWMFRRLLGALVAVHGAELVHGAVLPETFWIRPDQPGDSEDPRPVDVHNGILTEFSFCVRRGQALRAIVPGAKMFYGEEVIQKRPANGGTDLFMAAQTFCALVGGMHKLPYSLAGLARACFLSPNRRLCDVHELYEDFSKALVTLFGKPHFHRFTMP